MRCGDEGRWVVESSAKENGGLRVQDLGLESEYSQQLHPNHPSHSAVLRWWNSAARGSMYGASADKHLPLPAWIEVGDGCYLLEHNIGNRRIGNRV